MGVLEEIQLNDELYFDQLMLSERTLHSASCWQLGSVDSMEPMFGVLARRTTAQEEGL